MHTIRSSGPTAAGTRGRKESVGEQILSYADDSLLRALFQETPTHPPHPFSCRLPIVPDTWDSWRGRLARADTPHSHPAAHREAAEPTPGPWNKLRSPHCRPGQEKLALPFHHLGEAPDLPNARGWSSTAWRGPGLPKEGPALPSVASQGRLPVAAAGLNSFV